MTRTTIARATILLTSLSGCVGAAIPDGLGQAVAEVTTVPAGVGCLRVVYRIPGALTDTTRNFSVTPGASSTIDLGNLAPGAYSFRASAFNVACSSVATATVATWVGEPVPTTIAAGIVATVPITLRPNVTTRTTVDFVQPVRGVYAGYQASAMYAVLQDGSVRSWGNNDAGQLGDGTRTPTITPRVVTGLTNVRSISAAPMYACAVTYSGLSCWGLFGGFLADDGPGTSLTPRLNPDLEPDQISASVRGICGTFPFGVRCWTNIESAQSGPVDANATSAILSDSYHWDPPRQFTQTNSGVLTMRSVYSLAEPSPLSSYVSSFAVGGGWYCVTSVRGNVYCGGASSSGVLGDPPPPTAPPPDGPVRIAQDPTTALAAGTGHICALHEDRTVWCWGYNGQGQLGANVEGTASTTPQRVPLTDVVQIASSQNNSCALVADGSLWCWGRNDEGQVGDGTRIDRFAPVRVRF